MIFTARGGIFLFIMRRHFKITLLFLVLAVAIPVQRAEAIDPVTLAILAPVALKVAEKAQPYLARAALNGGKCLFMMGKDVFQTFYLPYGLLKMSLGAPFGGFRSGLIYTIRGGVAPAKLVVHTLMFPLMLIGLEINM